VEAIVEIIRAGVLLAIYGRIDKPPHHRHQVQRIAFRAAMLADYAWAW
jgi:hypothetical protein